MILEDADPAASQGAADGSDDTATVEA
jgi:hypothetical protein